jgi:outer membrane lipoprotein carrier protein
MTMMKNNVCLNVFVGAVLILAPGASLTAQTEDQVLTQLDELLSDISTLTAEVSQLIVESDGGVLEESDIRMKLKRPNGFYWETISPFPELIVTDGLKLWNYQPDLEQVVIEPWDISRSELTAQLLSGNTANLGEEYRLSRRDQGDTEFAEFVLLPREADSVYRQITLTFHNQMLDMIHIDSNNGQKTVWQFFNQVLNQTIPDQAFVFEPPSGVDVIENTYVQ